MTRPCIGRTRHVSRAGTQGGRLIRATRAEMTTPRATAGKFPNPTWQRLCASPPNDGKLLPWVAGVNIFGVSIQGGFTALSNSRLRDWGFRPSFPA